MEDWQERLAVEQRDLDSKLHKLNLFLGTTEFIELPPHEQRLLRRQQALMDVYSETLTARIYNATRRN